MSVNNKMKIQDLKEVFRQLEGTIIRGDLQHKPTGKFDRLSAYYFGRKIEGETTKEETEKEADVREHWNDTHFKRFNDERVLFIRSRKGFKYGRVTFEGKLPDLASYSPPDTEFWLGFEEGSGIGFGMAAFRWNEDDNMICWLGGYGDASVMKVNDPLPSDVKTTKYHYTVEVTNGIIEFRVDKDLVAVGVLGGKSMIVKNDTEPYAIVIAKEQPPMAMNTLMEFYSPDYGDEITAGFPAGGTRVTTVNPHPPKSYALYDDGSSTLLTEGTYDTGTSYKSHPVPVQGYSGKTLLFRADTDSVSGGLRIEVLTQEGNWRLYDSITASANELESYIISGNFPLARIGYEPSADGASITDAEIHLQ